MNIHEYQAKALLKSFGVSVSDGVPIMKADEAEAAAKSLPGPVWVVKSQIHAGGRGKGGGVKLAGSPDEAEAIATAILGMQLVTPQTGPEGQTVRKVPFFGDLPILGQLFRSERFVSEETELVIVITPTIARSYSAVQAPPPGFGSAR